MKFYKTNYQNRGNTVFHDCYMLSDDGATRVLIIRDADGTILRGDCRLQVYPGIPTSNLIEADQDRFLALLEQYLIDVIGEGIELLFDDY